MTLSDVMITNDTFRYDGHMLQNWWLQMWLSDLLVTHFTFRSGGHKCHFLTLLFTMDCLPAFNVLW